MAADPAGMRADIVTRFAPSPTGFLHIGGARTALFNWLYARHTGGKFLLRIEDTDRERSTEAAIAAILDGLTWLGLDWDGEPIYPVRPRRAPSRGRRRAAAPRARPIAATRRRRSSRRCARAARAEGRPPRYDGRWRDRDPSEAPAGVQAGHPPQGAARRRDRGRRQVQGHVAFDNEDLDDFVILRSDGTPTYMLAVVVDDHDMGVTHIIRGDDHLTNAARQTQIYEAHGLGGAGDGAHPADPRAGRREALQAPRRARRRGLSRDGLSAGGDAQLSRPARLEPWRRRDHSRPSR